MTANAKPLSIIAKCALCSTKTELFVCPHCDEVICQICVNKHRSELGETLKEHWLQCRKKFLHLRQLSSKHHVRASLRWPIGCLRHLDTYDKDLTVVEAEIDRVRTMIEQRYSGFVRLIASEKNNLLIHIEEYIKSISSKYVVGTFFNQTWHDRLSPSVSYGDLQQLFDSINRRLEDVFRYWSSKDYSGLLVPFVPRIGMEMWINPSMLKTFSWKSNIWID